MSVRPSYSLLSEYFSFQGAQPGFGGIQPQAHLPGGFIDPSTGAHVVQAPLERYTTYGAGWSRQGF